MSGKMYTQTIEAGEHILRHKSLYNIKKTQFICERDRHIRLKPDDQINKNHMTE